MCVLLILIIDVPSVHPQDVSNAAHTKSQSGPHRGGKEGGNKKERTESPLCLRSNRGRTHQHSETGQSFWSAISTAKEQSTRTGTQRKLHNKLTIQNGTWTGRGWIKHQLCKASLGSRGQISGRVGPRSRLRELGSSRPSRNIGP